MDINLDVSGNMDNYIDVNIIDRDANMDLACVYKNSYACLYLCGYMWVWIQTGI